MLLSSADFFHVFYFQIFQEYHHIVNYFRSISCLTCVGSGLDPNCLPSGPRPSLGLSYPVAGKELNVCVIILMALIFL